ncbi:MAG: hypothetical protein V1738_06175 [Patescibacteria group bacterium]
MEDTSSTKVEGLNTDDSVGSNSISNRVKKLPWSVRSYLLSEKFSDQFKAVVAKHQLDEEDADMVYVTQLHVMFGELPLEEFPDALWNRLSWEDSEENRARQLVVDLLGLMILPIQAYVGDVVGLIVRLGGKPTDYPQDKVENRTVTYEQAIKEIIEVSGWRSTDSADARRFQSIVESRLRDVRDELETKHMFTKPRKTGGLEMIEAEADRIIGVIEEEKKFTRYVEAGSADVVAGKSLPAQTKAESDFSPEEIKAILLGPAAEQKDIAKQVQIISDQSKGNSEVLREILYDYIYPQTMEIVDQAAVVAALMLFVRQGDLVSALLDDQRYQAVIKSYFDQIGAEIDSVIIAEPAGSSAMNVFLQTVLRGIAQYDESDSARFGLRIINALKKKGEGQYVELVAFDMDQGKFVWTDPISI